MDKSTYAERHSPIEHLLVVRLKLRSDRDRTNFTSLAVHRHSALSLIPEQSIKKSRLIRFIKGDIEREHLIPFPGRIDGNVCR